ncbi:hypothetical protein GCM10009585_17210 [Brevibacterium paucivorans]
MGLVQRNGSVGSGLSESCRHSFAHALVCIGVSVSRLLTGATRWLGTIGLLTGAAYRLGTM